MYSGKLVVFGEKSLQSGESGCNGAKWLYSEKVVVFEQKLFYSGKKWMYSENVVDLGQELL